MATSWTVNRSRERIETLFRSGGEDHELRAAALAEMRRTLGFSAYAWPLSDPETATGVAPMAQVPEDVAARLPQLIKAKYTSPVNRWTALSTAPSPVATLAGTTGGALSRRGPFEGMLRSYGVGDIVSVVYADQYGIWSWLDLWRGSDDPPFSDAETGFLASLAPAITTGFRRSRAAQFRSYDDERHTPPPPPQAVLVMDEEMRVLGQTASAEQWLGLLQRSPGPNSAIPAEVYNVVGQLLAKEYRVDVHAAAARVHIGGGQWAALRAARMDSPDSTGTPVASPPVAVTIQECPPAARLGVFVRSYGLTARERQALALLAAGLENEQLARRMGIAGYTAQDHFKSIFVKTGVHSRSGVLALALGGNARDDAAFLP